MIDQLPTDELRSDLVPGVGPRTHLPSTPPAESPALVPPRISDYVIGALSDMQVDGIAVAVLDGHFDPEAPGVGAQFLEHAQTYDERYFEADATISKIAGAVLRGGIPDFSPKMILDVGSGPGGSVLATASLFPEARIIASDLSPNMIAILMRRVLMAGVASRISTMVADASKLCPRPQRFDLILGSSMLHHLHDPFGSLKILLAGLAPGGMAVFYEPFQAGNVMLRQCLQEVIRRAPEHSDLSPCVEQALRTMVLGLDLMLEETRVHPVLQRLDDKWMFTRSQFQTACQQMGLLPPVITSMNPPTRTWEDKLRNLLRSGIGDTTPLPAWVTEIFISCDRNISPTLREELLMEGEIIFKRGETRTVARPQ